jgi:hypothetical protein
MPIAASMPLMTLAGTSEIKRPARRMPNSSCSAGQHQRHQEDGEGTQGFNGGDDDGDQSGGGAADGEAGGAEGGDDQAADDAGQQADEGR